MKLILTGGTGFIGSRLRETLTEKGYEAVVLTRRKVLENQQGIRTRYVTWDPAAGGNWEREFGEVEGVVNLAGEPIVGKRWTRQQKQKIVASRVKATQAVVRAIQGARNRPTVLINASAIGYYGARQDEELSEQSPSGADFLSETCQAWEREAVRAQGLGVRVVCLRIGIVLEKGGGALAKMLPPFQIGLGGPLGSGKQWMSWIHLDDLIGLIHLALENRQMNGPLNGTAPNPVRMREFTATLGRVLHRPAILPVPSFLLKILLGEMADVLLTGQRVLPSKALGLGYRFQFPKLEEAVKEILTK